MSEDVTPAALTPSSGLPAIPPPIDRGVRLPADLASQVRSENKIRLDSLLFTAACPGCGEDVKWAQHREDTHTHTVVDCRTCPNTYRACAACPPIAA